MRITHHKRNDTFGVPVGDCAPTGETLQLLAFPDVAPWYLNKIFPIERRVMKVARPMVQPFVSIPLPGGDIFGSGKDLPTDLGGMKKVRGDPKTGTARLVS